MADSSTSRFAVRVVATLNELPASYDDVFAAAPRHDFQVSRPWFENFVSTAMEDGATARFYGVEEAGEPVALLALRSPAGQPGSTLKSGVPPRSLASLTNHQASAFGLLHRDDTAVAAVAEALATTLAAERPTWAVIDINLLGEHDAFTEVVALAFERAGFVVRPYVYKGNWYQTVDGAGFDDYVKALPKPSKKQIKNYARKARRLLETDRARLEMHRDGSAVDRLVAAYEAIFARSWKEPEAFPNFTPGLFAAAAEAGGLRAGLLTIDDRPAAVEFGVLFGGRLTMMKTVYDPDFRKESAGSVVILETIRHVLDHDDVREIDFGTDDQDYKRIWLTERRERVGIVAFKVSTVGGFLALSRRTFGSWRDRIRQRIGAVIGRP